MRDYMFRNRWGALMFVAFTLAGVTKLVGTEQNEGALQQAAAKIEPERTLEPALVPDQVPQTTPLEVVPMTDEELIDPAKGFDPTPVDEFRPEIGTPELPPVELVNPVQPGNPPPGDTAVDQGTPSG